MSVIEPLEGRRLLSGSIDVVAGDGPSASGDGPSAPPADVTPPVSRIVVDNLYESGGTSHSVTVMYDDEGGHVDAATIDTEDVVLRRGEHTITATNVQTTLSGDATAAVAIYSFAAPGGTWDREDNGLYSVLLQENQVADVSGNFAAAAAVSFEVNVRASDRNPPTAHFNVANVTSASQFGSTVIVDFKDDVAFDHSTEYDVVVTCVGPGGVTLPVRLAGQALTVGPNLLHHIYEIQPPGGTWDAADNGTYTFAVAGALKDAAGNVLTPKSQTFEVKVPEEQSRPPVATISPGGDVTAAGGSTRDVVVTYEGDADVLASSIDTGDITVARDGGGSLAVTGVSVVPAGNGRFRTATYTVAAPGGTWDAADNGAYRVTVNAGQVLNVHGDAAATVSTTFNVNIAVPPPPLDEGFGGGAGTPGQAVNAGFVVEGAVVQKDGRIVLAGRQGDLSNGSSRYVLKRLNSDGSEDGSFGNNGMVMGPEGGNEAAYAVAVQDNGAIVIAGAFGGDVSVTRFKANGSVDQSFGGDGQVLIDFGAGNDAAYSIALAADGRIVIGGGSGGNFAFARLLANGQLDASFAQGGKALVGLAGDAVVGGVVILPDGKVAAAGTSGGNVAALRLNADGSRDASFGNSGVVVVSALGARADLGRGDNTVGVALQGDKLLVNNRSGNDFGIARLNADGSLDNAFGRGGIVTADFGGDDDADAIVVQGTGEIIVLGTTDEGANPRTAVAAFDPDGVPLESFGSAGKFTIDAGLTTSGRALQIGNLILRAFGNAGSDGRLLFGTSNQGSGSSSTTGVRRLNVPGSGLLGNFGMQSTGRSRKLPFVDADGTRILITMKGGGSGKAFYDGSNVDLVLTGTNAGTSVSVIGRFGDGRVTLRNVRSDGGLKSFSAKLGDLTGTFWSGGDVGSVALRSVTGTLAARGGIGKMSTAGDLANAKVLAGADLGSDYRLGGTGSATDAFEAASIGSVTVRGKVEGSVVGAGLFPGNTILLDGDDTVVGGSGSSIGSILVRKGVDAATRFVAGAVGKARLPGRVDPLNDPRFKIM